MAEQLLTRLGELLDSAPDQETFDQLYGVLRDLTGVTVAHLWEFATDRNASHVARRLLCAVAGRDVAPARSNAHSADGAAFIRAAKVRIQSSTLQTSFEPHFFCGESSGHQVVSKLQGPDLNTARVDRQRGAI